MDVITTRAITITTIITIIIVLIMLIDFVLAIIFIGMILAERNKIYFMLALADKHANMANALPMSNPLLGQTATILILKKLVI